MTNEMTIGSYATYLREMWGLDHTRFLADHPGLIDRILTYLSDIELVRLMVLAAEQEAAA